MTEQTVNIVATLTVAVLWAILLAIGVCVQRRHDRRLGEQQDRDRRARRVKQAMRAAGVRR